MRRWSNGYDCGLPSRLSGFEAAFLPRQKTWENATNLPSVVRLGFCYTKSKKLAKVPADAFFTMKYKRFFKRCTSGFFRDFSSFGNVFILILIYLLVFEGHQLVLALAGLMVIYLIGYIIKLFFHKKRPEHMEYSNSLEKMQSGSFPSIHSAVIMYSGLMVINQVNNLLVDISFAMLILVVGYSRYFLKMHYFKDIFVGYALGYLVFLFI